jgi:hypothetical protein
MDDSFCFFTPLHRVTNTASEKGYGVRFSGIMSEKRYTTGNTHCLLKMYNSYSACLAAISTMVYIRKDE